MAPILFTALASVNLLGSNSAGVSILLSGYPHHPNYNENRPHRGGHRGDPDRAGSAGISNQLIEPLDDFPHDGRSKIDRGMKKKGRENGGDERGNYSVRLD